ncbi:MAG: ABC transporter permease [Spirochaetales bacterium]|nr:ABC transporter permease [Spirochaetales bacterium]
MFNKTIKKIASEEAQSVPQGVSQWRLIKRKFLKNRLAKSGLVIIAILYTGAIFAEFLSPYHMDTIHDQFVQAPPQRVRWVDNDKKIHLRPFVYGYKKERDLNTFRVYYEEDRDIIFPIKLFVRGDSYKYWGLFETDLHLFGVEKPGTWFLFGTDATGKDLFSRILYGSRVSLTVGLIGVFLSIIFGTLMGITSGYFGGLVDNIIQRVIEVLMSFPQIPLWMALAAAIPPQWDPIFVYLGITLVLSLLGWGGLARQLRGKVLAMRKQEFVLAAKACGVSTPSIIVRHLVPNSLSHIIVIGTLAIPQMILGETALSFLGLGIKAPMTSWGVLLSQAQYVRILLHAPWLVIPVFWVVATVLAFNFVGDGLRDAADPYSI